MKYILLIMRVREMIKTKFKRIICDICKENPDLTDNGVNSFAAFKVYSSHKASKEEIIQKLEEGVRGLKSSHLEFNTCIEFLKNYDGKSEKSICSYVLKHQIEKDSGIYISNGILIAATLYLGLKIKKNRDKSSPNVSISLRDNSLGGVT